VGSVEGTVMVCNGARVGSIVELGLSVMHDGDTDDGSEEAAFPIVGVAVGLIDSEDGKTDGDLLEGELDVGLVVNGTLVGKQLGAVIELTEG